MSREREELLRIAAQIASRVEPTRARYIYHPNGSGVAYIEFEHDSRALIVARSIEIAKALIRSVDKETGQ